MNRCSSCRFWERATGGEYAFMMAPHQLESGPCRINPPVMVQGGQAIWPRTHKDDWCGKHEPKGENQS